MVQRDIIVIGGSAGSIEILTELARGLPAGFPAAVFIVVHIPAAAPSALASILGRATVLPTAPAEDGLAVEPGRIYVAPPGCHLQLGQGRMWLTSGPKENRHRPAIDPLFRTAAKAYGPRVIGVILSGSQSDGSAGLLSVRRAGGLAVVQSPETALHSSMPRTALQLVGADFVVAPEAMAGLLVQVSERPVAEREVQHTMMDIEERIRGAGDEEAVSAEDRRTQPGVPSTMSCPECHGTLWENRDGAVLDFRCRVGHAYSAETLIAHQAEQLEAALWTALRALEEHQALARRLASRAADRGYSHTAARFTEEAVDAEHHASVIRTVLHESTRSAPPVLVAEEPYRTER